MCISVQLFSCNLSPAGRCLIGLSIWLIRVRGTTGLHPDSTILTQGTTDVQNGRGHPKEQWQQENHKALIDGRNVGMALFYHSLDCCWVAVCVSDGYSIIPFKVVWMFEIV